MKKEIADKWVTALRSGNYNQSRGILKGQNGFCCLGVLCDIVKEDLNAEWDNDGFIFNEMSILPEQVQKHTGMCSKYGTATQAKSG